LKNKKVLVAESALMNASKQINRLNCKEGILNDETSKKTQNSPIKMKKTARTSKNSKEYRGCAGKLSEKLFDECVNENNC